MPVSPDLPWNLTPSTGRESKSRDMFPCLTSPQPVFSHNPEEAAQPACTLLQGTPLVHADEEEKEGHLGPKKESDARRDQSKDCSGRALNPDDGQECTGFSNQRAWQSEQDQGVMSGEVSLWPLFSWRARA